MENKILSGLRFSSQLSAIYSFIDTDARDNIVQISGKLEGKAKPSDIKNSIIHINQNGIQKGSFTLNQDYNSTINLQYPTKLSAFITDQDHETVTKKQKDQWTGKAEKQHIHEISGITNLQSSLDEKADFDIVVIRDPSKESIGNSTTPIYINKIGESTPIDYSIAKSVPSDAKFTDTVTTASTTGSGNVVTSITASNGALTVTKGSTFALSSDVKNATITLKQGGVTKGTFTLNQASNATINLEAGGGSGGSVYWGSIYGTLSSQTDLQNALNNKAATSDIKNSTITLKQGGVIKGTFTLNQASNGTIDLDASTTIATLTTIAAGGTMQPDGHYKMIMTGNTTLNASGGVVGKSGGAELFLNPGSYTFTAGTNLTLVNELTANKTNYCTLSWEGTACRMYVIQAY